MTRLAVYDPPLCCATGVCGPAVDPVLPRVAADLDWLKRQGVHVERYNLAQQPHAFATNPLISAELKQHGNDCLPMVVVDGQVAMRGGYPTRDDLIRLAGLEKSEACCAPKAETEACCAPKAETEACCAPKAESDACCAPKAETDACCAPRPATTDACCTPTPWWREEPGKSSCC